MPQYTLPLREASKKVRNPSHYEVHLTKQAKVAGMFS